MQEVWRRRASPFKVPRGEEFPPPRRDFRGAGAGGAASLAVPTVADASPQISIVDRGDLEPRLVARRPIVVCSANGLYRDNPNGSPIKKAYDLVAAGADPLDAAIAGVNVVELDPNDMSVGLGGLPNEEGVVQLDASCMHGPTKRAGAVGCLEDIATPAAVAKKVMDHTDRKSTRLNSSLSQISYAVFCLKKKN